MGKINVGSEGEKSTASFELDGKKIDGFFIKQVESVEEAEEQRKKWQSLKKRGVEVSPIFRIARDENSVVWIITKDLSEGGKKWVLSSNNREILEDPEYWRAVISINKQTKKKIVRNTLDVAIKAGTRGSDGRSLAFFRKNAKTYPLTLVVDKENPTLTQVVVVDLGIDVSFSEENSENIIKGNIEEAILFLSEVLGIFTEIPPDHSAYQYRDFFSDSEWRDFKNQKTYFDLYYLSKLLGINIT